jgi:hypothetical protein
MLTKLLLSALLIGHAAIHTGFVSARPPASAGGPPWPFELDRSWILVPAGIDPATARLLGTALVGATIAGFALAALATFGILPSALWTGGIAGGALASIALLALFFHPWLVLGVGIDLVLLWTVLVVRWSPTGAVG